MRVIAATSSGRGVTYQFASGKLTSVKVKSRHWETSPKRATKALRAEKSRPLTSQELASEAIALAFRR